MFQSTFFPRERQTLLDSFLFSCVLEAECWVLVAEPGLHSLRRAAIATLLEVVDEVDQVLVRVEREPLSHVDLAVGAVLEGLGR